MISVFLEHHVLETDALYNLGCLRFIIPRLGRRPIDHLRTRTHAKGDLVRSEREARVSFSTDLRRFWQKSKRVLDAVPPMVQLSQLAFEDKVEMKKGSDLICVPPAVYLICTNDARYGDPPTHALVVLRSPKFDIRPSLPAPVGGLVVSNHVCVLEAAGVRAGDPVAATKVAMSGLDCEVSGVAVDGD